jgi:hypothetical protein
MAIKKILFILVILLTSSIVSAQVLRGVGEITILIEDLDRDAIRCNLSKDMIDASIRLPLSNSKIRIVKNDTYPDSYLYANVIAIDAGSTCQIYVELAYQKYVKTEKKYGQFWRKNVLIGATKSNSPKIVGDDLESFTKQFLSAWLVDNSF